jgi:hypothetical protein
MNSPVTESSHSQSPESTESQPEAPKEIHPDREFEPLAAVQLFQETPDTRQLVSVKEAQAETERGEPPESVVEGPNFTIAPHAL